MGVPVVVRRHGRQRTAGDAWAVLYVGDDGARIVYEGVDDNEVPLGRIVGRDAAEIVLPLMALLARGRWEPAADDSAQLTIGVVGGVHERMRATRSAASPRKGYTFTRAGREPTNVEYLLENPGATIEAHLDMYFDSAVDRETARNGLKDTILEEIGGEDRWEDDFYLVDAIADSFIQREVMVRNTDDLVDTVLHNSNWERDEYVAEFLDEAKATLAASDVTIRVPEDVVQQILADGEIKTQFETGTSRGALNHDVRRANEMTQFGLDPFQTAANDRPVYGYVDVDGANDMRENKAATQLEANAYNRYLTLSQYGNVRVVLKDHVKDRTTFTVGDSLDNAARSSPMAEPAMDSWAGEYNLPKDLTPIRGATSPVFEDTRRYVEAQVHGGVHVTDIAYIVVPSGSDLGPMLDDANMAWMEEEAWDPYDYGLSMSAEGAVIYRRSDGAEMLDAGLDAEGRPLGRVRIGGKVFDPRLQVTILVHGGWTEVTGAAQLTIGEGSGRIRERMARRDRPVRPQGIHRCWTPSDSHGSDVGRPSAACTRRDRSRPGERHIRQPLQPASQRR